MRQSDNCVCRNRSNVNKLLCILLSYQKRHALDCNIFLCFSPVVSYKSTENYSLQIIRTPHRYGIFYTVICNILYKNVNISVLQSSKLRIVLTPIIAESCNLVLTVNNTMENRPSSEINCRQFGQESPHFIRNRVV